MTFNGFGIDPPPRKPLWVPLYPRRILAAAISSGAAGDRANGPGKISAAASTAPRPFRIISSPNPSRCSRANVPVRALGKPNSSLAQTQECNLIATRYNTPLISIWKIGDIGINIPIVKCTSGLPEQRIGHRYCQMDITKLVRPNGQPAPSRGPKKRGVRSRR